MSEHAPDEQTLLPGDEDRRGRVPPGQFLTEKWPVLTTGPTPRVDLSEWSFRVWGATGAPAEWDWETFMGLGGIEVEADFHCVTTWSRLDNRWSGVPARRILEEAPPDPDATHVMVHCYGGYTTNLPLTDFEDPDVLFAHAHDGEPLSPEHGWPLRLIVPARYAWKSAKWVNGVEYMVGDRRGFWEGYGYHNNADPWEEERYG